MKYVLLFVLMISLLGSFTKIDEPIWFCHTQARFEKSSVCCMTLVNARTEEQACKLFDAFVKKQTLYGKYISEFKTTRSITRVEKIGTIK